jgi:long-subunit acyl-CoA synthetase (AMP-forming)
VSGAGEPQPYALLVLAEDVRTRLADPIERARIERHLEELLARVNSELADYEQLQMLVVAPEPWTIENGCLTPTMKIKRRGIESAAQAWVNPWYGTRRPVVWA